MARVLITGASGFIGKAVLKQALRQGHTLAVLSRSGVQPSSDVFLVAGSIENPDWSAITAFRPEVCIHCAWIATPGVFWNSDQNEILADASIRFFQNLVANGLTKIVGLGSCAEYADSPTPVSETCPPPIGDLSPYTKSKLKLLQHLPGIVGRDCSFAWMRIFHAYGPGEHPARFISWAISQLSQNIRIRVKCPDDVVDYVHVEDVASAVLAAISPDIEGILNIGTGVPNKIAAVARRIGSLLGKEGLIDFDAQTHFRFCVADISRLKLSGWNPTKILALSVAEMLPAI